MTISKYNRQTISEIIERFSLGELPRQIDLDSLAKQWGVVSIDREPISSEAMLLNYGDGYRIILKDIVGETFRPRQRFSYAHELGHLLLDICGLGKRTDLLTKHRDPSRQNQEERLCDQLAAEILMPRDAFRDDGFENGWSLEGLRKLSREYETSMPATARRMVDLAPETILFAIWRSNEKSSNGPRLKQSYAREFRYAIPNAKPLLNRRMWLISRAMKSQDVQFGVAPAIDKRKGGLMPPDVSAEALAWGRGEHRQVMVYYYPERKLTEDMVDLGNATWRT